MMATAEPPSSSSFLPLLESLEDSAAGQSEQTDAYLTIANRLSGEESRQFLPAVEKNFSRLGKATLAHVTSPNTELSQAALQALGFCVYHSRVVSGLPETFVAEILSALCSLAVKSTDKNTCTRALWVISKQSFPQDMVAKKVSSILDTLESVWSREDIQSVVMEHEALNVVIRMLEQVPTQMGDGVVRWAKLIIPLVVHSASKVRLRAAAAMELGMPLLLEKQAAVAAIIEPMMSTKLIPELQKLFMSKNETNVLKLWPLFVKLLGKLLHRGGPFINSLLHLEELGFRSSSPTIKKIAFIAWKSLIDNFALNPDILCSSKRMKLLMQPLSSINVRTEALLLTKVEVWWYLVVQLGPNLFPNFDQVSVPLLQCTIGSDSSSVPGTPSRAVSQNGAVAPATPKTAGTAGFNSPANTSRMSLNSSVQMPTTFPSIQLLGLEMLLHYFLGPEVITTAAKNKLILSLEPLNHPLLSSASSFTKHAAVLTSNIRDGFTNIGKDAPGSLLAVLWTSLVRCVNSTIESGSKKDRQGCEVLTLMLQALQSIVTSEALPADKVLILFEATVKGIPQRVLGSASYQVGKMDVLNGTPALFLILLLYNSSMLAAYMEDERFYQCLQTLVGCGLSGPTSPLAFGEAVLGAIGRSAPSLQNKEQLLRMWSVVVSPLTDTITQSNEVNQGDALEHNFSAMHSALLFPITQLLPGTPLQQATQKSMLSTWSKLYKVFARCSSLVVTAEENICCEEFCAKMTAAIDRDALMVPSTLNAVASILQVVVECVDFSPYTPQFQQKLKSPHTPVNWMKKRSKVMGNLSTFQSLLVQCLEVYLEGPEASSDATGLALVSTLSALFTNLALPNTIREALTSLIQPLTLLCKQASSEPPIFPQHLLGKLEKLYSDVLGCLQTRSALAYDGELLVLLSPLLCVLFPHKNKQLRNSVTQFWNSTFANSTSLTYPDEIRPILSQVKQKTPIILPCFEVVSVPDELSGQYSSESSQLETKLSGMPVSSVGKRDSLLGKSAELKDKSATKTSKPVSTKLDFGSPKPPRREVLEEEASIDFVFIPPETKERVLTEHQKEVKRTKRVDIPAMYNNLDASLDTTVFSQYTQSQEESLDKLQTEQADSVGKEAPGKVPQETVDKEEDTEILTKETQDYASPKAVENMAENCEQEEMIPESADVSMEDDVKSDDRAEDFDMESKEGTSPNVSGTSDLVSGTPQKPNSRRQSFITLEKYAEGKPASPSSTSTFTGPLIKTSNSQERTKTNKTSTSSASQTSTGPNSQDSLSTPTRNVNSPCPVKDAPESPQRPKDSVTKCEPVRLTERMPSDTTEDEDVIPDTQTELEQKESKKMPSTLDNLEPSSQEEESEQTLDDSQSSVTQTSPSEPRRSGRCRVRPLLPGEDPKEREEKNTQVKRRRSGEEPKSDSASSIPVQSRRSTRSQQAAEEDGGKDRLRTRAQRDKSESSQTDSQGRAHKRIKLYNNSQEFLDKPEPKRRSTRGHESSQTDLLSGSQADSESQSQGRHKQGRRSKSSVDSKEEVGIKKRVLPDKRESSQITTNELEVVEQNKKDDKQNGDPQVGTLSPQSSGKSQEFELLEQKEKDKQEKHSQMITQSSGESQEFEVVEQTDKKDSNPEEHSQMITQSSQSSVKSQEIDFIEQNEKEDNKPGKDSQMITEFELIEQNEKEDNKPGKDSPMITEFELIEKTDKEDDSQKIPSSPSNDESQHQTSPTNKFVTESELKNDHKISEGTNDNLSQEGPQVSTPSDSQSIRRSRRSKASSEAAESEDKNESKGSLGRETRSNSQAALSAVSHAETSVGGRTRRSKVHEDQSKSSPCSTPESSQSLDGVGSTESSKGRGRYARRKSSQVLVANAGSSESESSEARENSPMPKKRGRKPRASLQSPLTLEFKDKMNSDMVKNDSDTSPKADTQSKEAKNATDLEEPDLQSSESLEKTPQIKEQINNESLVEVEADAVVEEPDTENTVESKSLSVSPCKERQRQKDLKHIDDASLQESDSGDLKSAEILESVEISTEQSQEKLPSDTCVSPAMDTLSVPETTGKLLASVSSEEITEKVSEPSASVTEKQTDDSESNQPVVPEVELAEDSHISSFGQNQMECPNVTDEEQAASVKEDNSPNQPTEASAGDDITPLLDSSEDGQTQAMECQDEEETQTTNTENDVANLDSALPDVCNTSEPTCKDAFQGSPVKQKDLEAVMGSDVGQSPSSGRTRGTWSPSASPSTSILKKGQKRPLEDETPSPLVKSRRVSFADPIQRQEMADDIDRRSPAIRTSSPRRSKISNIPQPKYVTTPTKGLLILSPRNLHSPGYKSSKKCLISEMSQEPRPVSRDCIYPALVGCSTPVEAVLPQISSNMWSRGFGQLVRARNIKTVGDLSALTPSEIKTLPIRSPKISNVKKALKIYEQQRKGRGGDELKSFDETEMLTSELEETSAPENQDEEDKTSAETLATELVDEPVPADRRPEQDCLENQAADTMAKERGPEGLLSEVEALTSRMTPLELSYCAPEQLGQMHDQLGGMMRRVVVELQTRLCQRDDKPCRDF
ncbi:telomere-associated protein RIF1 isoform X2 [Sparus aurata]|uniref:telomere-associated protein RIF1 isoform X2 n=1 Tax=Sparus aurata TaxID=8175 RepID=UPI0011C0C931|nr:telomere-associated protein RIF1 isoform X2 [Sparus aurata]